MKIYTDGISTVAGYNKGELDNSSFSVLKTFDPSKEELKILKEYGNCIVFVDNEYIAASNNLHIGALSVNADKKIYDYQFSKQGAIIA
jgi:hypothetical protein